MKITNNSKRVEGFHTARGLVQIKPGETRTVELDEAGLKLAKRLPYLDIAHNGGTVQVKQTPLVGEAGPEAIMPKSAGFTIEQTSPGWYAVNKAGVIVTKKMRKDDIDGFDEFSAEDKAAFVEANKADD